MSSHRTMSVITYSLLVVAGAVSFMLPDSLPTVQATSSASTDVHITGTVRDFKEWNVAGGHSDFDLDVRGSAWVGCSTGVWNGFVADTLGADGKPMYAGPGVLITSDWRDSGDRPIYRGLYSAARGDHAGSTGCSGSAGVASAASFNQWFNDVPGVNMSEPLSLTLVRQADGSYVFDDTLDPVCRTRDGFFPIDGRLFGNPPVKKGTDHNFHFTFELHASFTYKAADAQMFKFVGDDDVFVFIDGRKVIDLGGIHAAREQHVDLSRLGLVDGRTYSLAFFFAERNRVASNFRMVTNLQLQAAVVPSISAAFD